MAIAADFLEKNPYFANLSVNDLSQIQRLIFEKEFERGDLIALEGEPSAALYFVFSGAVKIFKTSDDGKEQIVSITRPGDSFNDVSIFDGEPSPFSAQAMGPVTVYGIDKGDVENILREHCQVALNVVNVLAGRIRYLSALVEDLSFRPVIRRVAKILLEYAENGGGNPQRLTQQEMAAMAGTAREVVARSIRDLESRGTLRLDRHRIVITDRSALREIAGVAD